MRRNDTGHRRASCAASAWRRTVWAMKITELFWLILAAILLALGATPASAAGSETTAVLKSQTQELMDAVTDGKADIWQRYLADDALYAAEDGSVKTKA